MSGPLAEIVVILRIRPMPRSQATLLARIPPVRDHGPRRPSDRGPVLPAPPAPIDWPDVWARCWLRIRNWGVPPRWSDSDWRDEARAEGGLAAAIACCEFDPGRGVPFDGFLFRRVADAVWTRYRQECSYGRRMRPDEPITDLPSPASPGPDPDSLASLQCALDSLPKPDGLLIRLLFWDGRREGDLALERGLSRQSVNRRKRKILIALRSHVEML